MGADWELRVPVATYRVQLSEEQPFSAVEAWADHIGNLGVSHVYLPPILQAVPGSTHGYDVVDHNTISADLGGESGLQRLSEALHDEHLSIVLDIVPNHVALPTPESLNPMLWSLLRYGADSPYVNAFDLDFTSGSQVLMPILGQRIDQVLADGELTVSTLESTGEPVLRYYDHVLPIRTGTEDLELERLLASQHYRLAFWQVASEELNYRRFFDVDTLVAVRVEDPQVFADTHRTIVGLVLDGTVSGLRVDHPDGLADPLTYLDQLKHAAGEPWIVIEKILIGNETLSRDLRCDGTTGYDALRVIGSLFVDPSGGPALQAAFAEFTGMPQSWAQTVHSSKVEVLSTTLVAELDRLAGLAHTICQDDIRLRDHTRRGLTEALAELLTHLEVYRAYVQPGEVASALATEQITEAAEHASACLPERNAEIELLAELALGIRGRGPTLDEFVVRFQQTTGPVMAKGVEDTASYRWFPLAALNEVGGEPAEFGIKLSDFHEFNSLRLRSWPNTMNALSTHDTKRSEDVRARLFALSEDAESWIDAVRSWTAQVSPLIAPDGTRDRTTEWLAFQTIVGTWPISPERMTRYLIKATREAKIHTSWLRADTEYELAIAAFVDNLYFNPDLMQEIEEYVDSLDPSFVTNCLGQRAVQLLMPGVPDIYRGCETVSLRLVDPDNRVPLDDAELQETSVRSEQTQLDPYRDLAAAKLRLTREGLLLRQRHREQLGRTSTYQPLVVRGSAEEYIVGFIRSDSIACVVSRFAGSLEPEQLDDTQLSLDGQWRNVLTGQELDAGNNARLTVSEVLGNWPVALLERVTPS